MPSQKAVRRHGLKAICVFHVWGVPAGDVSGATLGIRAKGHALTVLLLIVLIISSVHQIQLLALLKWPLRFQQCSSLWVSNP